MFMQRALVEQAREVENRANRIRAIFRGTEDEARRLLDEFAAVAATTTERPEAAWCVYNGKIVEGVSHADALNALQDWIERRVIGAV